MVWLSADSISSTFVMVCFRKKVIKSFFTIVCEVLSENQKLHLEYKKYIRMKFVNGEIVEYKKKLHF